MPRQLLIKDYGTHFTGQNGQGQMVMARDVEGVLRKLNIRCGGDPEGTISSWFEAASIIDTMLGPGRPENSTIQTGVETG